MYTFIFLALIILILTLPFSLYHLIVAGLAIAQKNFNKGIKCILIGSILTMLSLFLHFYMPIMFESFIPVISLLIWIIGVVLICYGAYWNGKQKENFHPAHHLIRIGIALVLTILLALVQ